jgi:hypothetical protein
VIAPPFLRGVGYKFSERFGVRQLGGRFCDSHIGDLYNSGSRAPALQGSDGALFLVVQEPEALWKSGRLG